MSAEEKAVLAVAGLAVGFLAAAAVAAVLEDWKLAAVWAAAVVAMLAAKANKDFEAAAAGLAAAAVFLAMVAMGDRVDTLEVENKTLKQELEEMKRKECLFF